MSSVDRTQQMRKPLGEGELPKEHRALLVVIEGKDAGLEFELKSKETIIGRDETVDLVIDDPGASRKHFIIEFSKLAFIISDMQSTNGTLVNGDEVVQKTLEHGDKISVGETLLQFVIEEKESEGEVCEIET